MSEECALQPHFLFYLWYHNNKLGKTQCINFWLFIIALDEQTCDLNKDRYLKITVTSNNQFT